jgi:hypothetical protein
MLTVEPRGKEVAMETAAASTARTLVTTALATPSVVVRAAGRSV